MNASIPEYTSSVFSQLGTLHCVILVPFVVGLLVRLALCSPGHQGDDLIRKEVAALVSLGP